MSKCPKCKRPINDGNSPNEFECTEPDDDEGVCEAYAKIAALRTRLAESEASLEEYRMRLAGALTTSEGNNLDVQDDPRSLDYLRRCPTIRSVVRLRAERDDLLGALRKCHSALEWAAHNELDPTPSFVHQALRRARAAIAKVGGKESK